ncbi:MAG: hypothetical protein R3211_02920 [Balneolaceae bacterium]|nr:hypothetical protein [Balneolaceae bacterium]
MDTYHVSWWNVENLFDVEDSDWRPDYLQRRLRNELRGWDSTVLNQKISQLARIITQLNSGQGPDILGICEVENQAVLELLVDELSPLNRNYGIAHHDTSDNRGIDIAFIFDEDLFTFEQQFHYEVLKRSATRDIFQVNLRTRHGRGLILIGNHWPARSGGVLETEPYRIIAAETMSYWMERIFEIRGRDIPVLIMGDFNDEPFNRSMTEYALSTHSEQKVINSRSPRLFNLMWPAKGAGIGTHYYNYFPHVLDQFLVSRGMLQDDSPIRLAGTDGSYNVSVDKLPEMRSGGDYEEPIRFSRPSESSYEPQGFSDHYPISVELVEDD